MNKNSFAATSHTFLIAICMGSFLAILIFFFVMLSSEQVLLQSQEAKINAYYVYTSSEQKKEKEGGRIDSPAFQQREPIPLHHAQLVTFMKHIPSLHSYKRVRLERAEIFIDYQVKSNRWEEDQIYADAYQALKHLYSYTSNMKHLYMRFILTDGVDQTLIIAITSRLDDINKAELVEELSMEEQRVFILENTRVVYGTGWRK